MDPKLLKTILKIMRENGVLHLKTADVELTLSPDSLFPNKQDKVHQDQSEIPTDNPFVDFPSGMLTPEQLMFYSSGGMPSEDPNREDS